MIRKRTIPGKYFWDSWENVTPQEKAGIRSAYNAKELILSNFPPEKIVGMYVFGSFFRREMRRGSDVDIWAIVRDNGLVSEVAKFSKEHENGSSPKIGMSQVYSLWEFENNENLPSKKLAPSPSRVLWKIRSGKAGLLHGDIRELDKFRAMNDKEALDGIVEGFKQYFIPLYKKSKFPFSLFVKSVFELTEAELSYKGKSVTFWRQMVEMTPNTHPSHKAWEYWKNLPEEDKIRVEFIEEVERYLKRIER